MTRVSSLRRLVLAFVFCASVFTSATSHAQATVPQPADPNIPQVTYELDWKDADPHWFQVVIDSTGRATYQSQPRADQGQAPGDPYIEKFTATETTRNAVLKLADDLNHFRGQYQYTGKINVAYTGTRTLHYQSQGQTTTAIYKFTENKQMNELNDIFQRISTTFETGRRLSYAVRFDKMGMDKVLRDLEELQKTNRLAELQVLIPTLQNALNDRALMNMSRQRAQRLLNLANAAANDKPASATTAAQSRQ